MRNKDWATNKTGYGGQKVYNISKGWVIFIGWVGVGQNDLTLLKITLMLPTSVNTPPLQRTIVTEL